MKKPKPGWEIFCEHANEVPNVCPCPPTCGCRYSMCKESTLTTVVWRIREDRFTLLVDENMDMMLGSARVNGQSVSLARWDSELEFAVRQAAS